MWHLGYENAYDTDHVLKKLMIEWKQDTLTHLNEMVAVTETAAQKLYKAHVGIILKFRSFKNVL